MKKISIACAVATVACLPATSALAASCDSLAKLALKDTAITKAEVVTAGAFSQPGGRGGRGSNAFKALAEFCRVTATLTPTFGNVMLVNVGACAAGVDVGSGVTVASPGSNTVFFNDTGTYAPSAGCDDSLTAFIAFSGSGGNTNYGLTGGVVITGVPEPTSVGILGLAILGMLGVRRRSNAAMRQTSVATAATRCC